MTYHQHEKSNFQILQYLYIPGIRKYKHRHLIGDERGQLDSAA